jgi:hypothetical protein
MTLQERIKASYRRGIGYSELMRAVFPEEQYPNAWRYQSNGGPPGCAMSFGKALKQLGLVRSSRRSGDVVSKTESCGW